MPQFLTLCHLLIFGPKHLSWVCGKVFVHDDNKKHEYVCYTILSNLALLHSGVIPGDAGGAMAPPDFGRSVNPISIKGGPIVPAK